jgi:predicted nucleotidyltransferase
MEIIKKIKEYFKNSDYLFVLIFGSYAKNDFTNLSDIDIGIYFKDNPNYKEIGYHSLKLEELLNKKIDLIALNDIYKKNPLFSFEILKLNANYTTLMQNL